MSRPLSRGRSGRRVIAHVIAGHPTQPDSVLYAPQRPWEDWTPQPPGTFHFHHNGSRQSEITLEVSMRDIIENSKPSSDPFERRYSSDSTRTANDESMKPSDFGNEKGDKALPPAPVVPVGFWDHRLAKTRKEVLKGWLKITLILSVFILTVLSLYWGALSHIDQNISSLTVFVVDFDGMAPYTDVTPLVGPLIVKNTEARLAFPDPHLGYQTLPPSHFGNDPLNVRQEVYDYKAWAGIVINPNATALLQQAIETGNSSYDPSGAFQFFYVEARDHDTVHTHIWPELHLLCKDVTERFGSQWTQSVLANSSITRNQLELAPQALSPAIGYSEYNLRPFHPPVALPAVTIGLIYLIIISFFSFAFYMPTHMRFLIPAGHPPLRFNQFVFYRWIATMGAYFFMSLAYSFVSLAFRIPFSNQPAPGYLPVHNPDAYGQATFVVYWMINFFGMCALGMACENVAMIIGQPWTAMWLIFWVISNVSTSFYALDITPKFYYWGYAWPLHNIVEASRQVLFGLHSRIGLNLGILLAWCAINSALFPFCCYFMRWKTAKEKKAAAQAAKGVKGAGKE